MSALFQTWKRDFIDATRNVTEECKKKKKDDPCRFGLTRLQNRTNLYVYLQGHVSQVLFGNFEDMFGETAL